MPELPEVETIRRELHSRIIGQRIRSCTILRPDVIAYPLEPEVFCQEVIGETVVNVTRKAKYLIVELTLRKQLVFHLRLSGSIFVRPKDTTPERFTRVAFKLDGYELFFNEPRVLGRLYLLRPTDTVQVPKGLYSLGLEPISAAFTMQYLQEKLKGRKTKIKAILLDQTICAGVGNIYSDEALFRAGIRPTRRAYRVTKKEIEKLVNALKAILQKAVKKFGTSVGDYVRTNGTTGSFQNFLFVYQREGEPCRICGVEIKVLKFGNRSTRYCPKCQK